MKFDKLFASSTTNGTEFTIAEVSKIVEELMYVLDDVVPCFPPKNPSKKTKQTHTTNAINV